VSTSRRILVRLAAVVVVPVAVMMVLLVPALPLVVTVMGVVTWIVMLGVEG
jgi:hypothetical protein